MNNSKIRKQTTLLGISSNKYCPFCKIIRKEIQGYIVYENKDIVTFLDHNPLFWGHCLLVPRKHFETFRDLPQNLTGSLFGAVQMVSQAVEVGLKANGTFIAINNKVSQSVPHFHVHIVPRRYKDGLKGFFWPRIPYRNQDE
ncbi:MAG: HIT family protein, partial [Candidatus Thorarchaeota archaeon]